MSLRNFGLIAALAMLAAGSAQAADNDSKPDKSSIVFACDATHNACLDACQRANNGVNVLSRGDRDACETRCTEIYAQCLNSANAAASGKAPQSSRPGAVAQ